RSSSARFQKLKACVTSTESAATRMKKVFIVQPKSPKSNEFYVTIEIKSEHEESDILEVIEENESGELNFHFVQERAETTPAVVKKTGEWVIVDPFYLFSTNGITLSNPEAVIFDP
ncbi:hypothetical protein Tco_1333527, partial [Tanacetum coccineum]